MSISTTEQSGTLAAGEKSPPIRLDLYSSGAQSELRFSLTTNKNCKIYASYGGLNHTYTNPDSEEDELVPEDYGNLPHNLDEQTHAAGSKMYMLPVNWGARRWEFQLENISADPMTYDANAGSGNE